MGRIKNSGLMMAPGDSREMCEVECRPIENGYVVREMRMSGGDYSSREYFSPTKPTMPQMSPSTGVGPEGLRGAMAELKRSK